MISVITTDDPCVLILDNFLAVSVSTCLTMGGLTLALVGNILTILFLLFGIFYVYAKYKLSYWKRRGVLSPSTNLIFGNFKDAAFLRVSPNKILAQVYELAKDSPYVGFYVFHKPCLLVKSPELLKAILVRDFDVFSDRQFGGRAKRDIIGTQNLFSMNNPEWKYARSKISPALTSGKLKKMIPLMIEAAKAMLEYIEIQPTEQNSLKSMDIRDTSSKYTTNIISSLAFGIQTNSFQVPEPEFRNYGRKIVDTNLRRVLNLFVVLFFPELSDTLKTSMLGESENFFRDVFWNSINTREKSGIKRGDLIDSLIQLKNEEQHPDFKFSGDYLFAHAAIFFVAGYETSSITMAFTLLELAKQPEIQEKARQDIKEQFEKYGVTQEAFQEMKYLNQVVSETLRMYPPAPILDRVALKDYQIPGSDVIIEKGTSIFVPLLGLHADPKYFPEPLKYDPDRFSEERKKSIPSMTYMPFGEGPRYCIGQRIGLLQTTIGLSMILSEYEVSLNPNIEYVINERALFLQPLNGIQLHLKKITSKNMNS